MGKAPHWTASRALNPLQCQMHKPSQHLASSHRAASPAGRSYHCLQHLQLQPGWTRIIGMNVGRCRTDAGWQATGSDAGEPMAVPERIGCRDVGGKSAGQVAPTHCHCHCVSLPATHYGCRVGGIGAVTRGRQQCRLQRIRRKRPPPRRGAGRCWCQCRRGPEPLRVRLPRAVLRRAGARRTVFGRMSASREARCSPVLRPEPRQTTPFR